MIKVSFGAETINAYVNAGPCVSYLLSGRVKGKGNVLGLLGGDLDEPIDFTDDPTPGDITELDANRMDLGANFGGGIGFNFSETSGVFIDARYNYCRPEIWFLKYVISKINPKFV